jgi:hypothetical protein
MYLGFGGCGRFSLEFQKRVEYKLKDIAPGAWEKPVCRIWLKIDILVDFEVLNKV